MLDEERYLSIPDDTRLGATVFTDPNITYPALALYGNLLRYVDVNRKCVIKLKQMEKDLHVRRSSVIRSLRSLVQNGVIKRKRGFRVVRITLLR